MTVSFKTLGCKLNQSETDALADQFKKAGFTVRDFTEPVDLAVINTCTVTNDADSKSRAAIRLAIRTSPQARVVVTGCYAQIKPEEIKAIAGVNLILGTDEKYRILDHLKTLADHELQEPLTIVNDRGEFDEVSVDGFISATSRARAFLKVQEGCDYYCSYCIIPFARGKARSRPFENTLNEARLLAAQGYQEIVLTGINIGTYQVNSDQTYHLVDLLKGLEKISGLKRIRISSIEPNTVTDELLQTIAESEVVCPHLHIPLQSGNDDLLQAMNRKYRLTDYARLMERFQYYLPNAALGTDVIVGFPGETEKHFQNTLEFIEHQPFTYMHVFRYSDRSGTVAAKLVNHVDPEAIKHRSKVLASLMQKQKANYAKKFVGCSMPVLFDQNDHPRYSGYTKNYLRVQVESESELRKEIHLVKLNEENGGVFFGHHQTLSCPTCQDRSS